MASNSELAEKLNTAWRFFYKQGLIDGFGHISARTETSDRFLISPHSLGKHSTPEDFVIVDLDGNQIASDAPLPGELPIHLETYRHRPDVGAVAHFHCLHATSFTMSRQELGPSYFLASIFRDGIPVHPDSRLISDKERGEALAATLGSHRVALMKAHGAVITGKDIEEMVTCVFILEDNARRTWISAAMGPVEFLTEETMAEIEAEMLKTGGLYRRIWAFCQSEADDDGGR